VHFCLCTPTAATRQLGRDGHPARDEDPASFLPPVPLPRRMWAASRIAFHRSLRLADPVTRLSRVSSIEEKAGSTGPLVFVEVVHETRVQDTRAVTETQTLVYREAAAPDAPLQPSEPTSGRFDKSGWSAHTAITPSNALLLRYSALTFNAHRIHYDAPYARGEERYRGCVVHGPLIASLLLQLAARELGDNALARFEFRATSPAIAGDLLHLAMREEGETFELGAFAADGRQVMKATAARNQAG
ncbi:FAS1-like dehydratase domain-containing protein, partial [Erythrobacter sp.]|uniref:FAS1-like dehydratase domain-containing protein n=1 Tax=Erythrobacter sp. TaxID=1042 RepID=UPI003C71B2F8